MQGDFRVGDWIVHPTINALERDGQTIHLEPKVMQVLLALAREPGEVVSRERVRSAVWPDVFVGDDVLVRAISELRRAFGDDPRSSHTIQTVPKAGYRLIATVAWPEPAPPTQEVPTPAVAMAPETAVPEPTTLRLEASAPSPGSQRWKAIAAAGVLFLIAAAVFVFLRGGISPRPSLSPETYTTRPLTTYPGSQLQAAFSPDGTMVAFVWRKQGEQNGHLYLKPTTAAKFVTSEVPVRLTSGDADETSPAWSPNGRFVAFIRHDAERTVVGVIPSIGGEAQQVYVLPVNIVWEYGGLSWSADGNSLIFPQTTAPQTPSALVELNLRDHSLHSLTTPPAGWDGDWTPSVSPDGKYLAFVRGPDRSARDLYVMTLPDGEPRQLTHDGRLIIGITWTPDSSSLVFASNRGGSVSLWRLPKTGGTPEHERAGGDDAYSPSISPGGGRMVYSHGSARWSMMSVPLGAKGAGEPTEILTSSEQDASPHISPDGSSLAFQSWRSGSQEIWKSNMDGSNPVQLTSGGNSAGSPSWSPMAAGSRLTHTSTPTRISLLLRPMAIPCGP